MAFLLVAITKWLVNSKFKQKCRKCLRVVKGTSKGHTLHLMVIMRSSNNLRSSCFFEINIYNAACPNLSYLLFLFKFILFVRLSATMPISNVEGQCRKLKKLITFFQCKATAMWGCTKGRGLRSPTYSPHSMPRSHLTSSSSSLRLNWSRLMLKNDRILKR